MSRALRWLCLLGCLAALLYGGAALTQQGQLPGPPPAPFGSQLPGETEVNRSQLPNTTPTGGPPAPGTCSGTLDLSTGCAQLVAFGGLF